MGTNIVFDGVTYSIPATNDVAWGTEVTKFLKGLPAGILSRAGGQFHLTTADLDFGLSKGLAALYFKSKTANIANTGVLRLAQADFIAWRNEAGSADLALKKDDTNFLTWNDIQLLDASSAQTLTNKTIDADLNTVTNIRDQNVAADAAIDYPKIAIDDGEIAYEKLNLTGKITNADISATANIDGSKVNTDFGPSQIITSGGLRLGTTHHVMLNADPSEDYDFIFPDTDGVDGQALVRQSGELVWASIPGLSLPHYNITVGDAGSLPQAVDTSAVGDIQADETAGLTIKNGVITDIMISGAAAIDTTKLAALTPSSYVITDASGYLDTTTINPLDKAGDTMTGLLGLDSEGLLFDTVTASPAAPSVGQTFWDDMDKTIATKLSTDVTLQHGQEMHLYVLNNSGALITNGTLVYVNSANTARPTIRKAQADSSTTADLTIGMVTADIADSGYGYVTTFGLVRGVTTNVDGDGQAVTDGTEIFLSATTAGEWVKTAPSAPNHRVRVGQVLNAGGGASGTILVSVEHGSHLEELHDVGITAVADRDTLEYDTALGYWKNIPSVKGYTKEETGFADPAGVTVTYNVDMTVTLTHSTAIIYLYRGEVFNLGTTWTSTAHNSATDVSYFLTMYENGAHSWGTVFPGFDNGVYVAYIYYGATTKFAIRECHGLMNWQAWEEFHRTIGTYRVSGGLVPAASWVANTYTTAAVTPAVDSAVIQDEDLPTTIPALADGSTYTRIHFDTGNVVFSTASTLPFPNDGTNIQYNQNPTSGTALTAITTNARFVNIYGIFVPSTADAGSQAYRILWMTGQQIYTTLAAAQGEDFRTLSTGNLATLFPEFVPFIRVTYERQTAGGSTTTFNARIPTNGVSYIVGTRAGLTSVTGFTPTDHNTLTGRSDAGSHPSTAVSTDTTNFNRALSVSDTTVQAALDTIDNTMVTPTSADALSNKSLTAPVISDYQSMTEVATPSAPSAGSLKVYAKTDDKLYTLNSAGVEVPVGSGSGSSSEINYISNPLFEETANAATPSGWVTYADAAATTPVDGTGGSPNVTFTASTSSPIRGLVSAVFTKDAANRQGQGVAYAFTIPAVDKGKLVGINFDITPAGSYASSDMSVYVYDVTNSALLTPAAVSIPNNVGTFTTSFGLTAGTSYRLILHVASTNASAYTLKVDNVSVGYKPTPQGAVVEGGLAYTPSALSNATLVTAIRERVGESARIRISWTYTGNAGLSYTPAQILPSGLTVNESKLAGTVRDSLGTYVYNDSGTAILTGTAFYRKDTDMFNIDPSVTPAVNDTVTLDITVPIAEWAGSGVVNLAQNDVEYAASTTGTWDAAAAAANTVYGPAGAPITGALATYRTKVVRFQTPIQPSDIITVELSDDGLYWCPASYAKYKGSLIVPCVNAAGSLFSGIWVNKTSGNTTDVDVLFGQWPNMANDDSPADAWAAGGFWRVRKTSAGAAVGFGPYVPGVSTGLVPAAGLPGRTDGQAVASGYVGEIFGTVRTGTGGFTYSARATTALTGSHANLVAITLNKGEYLVTGIWQGGSSSGTFNGLYQLAIGGSAVTSEFEFDTVVSTVVSGSIPSIPIVITADATVVSLTGKIQNGTSAYNKQELFCHRIA